MTLAKTRTIFICQQCGSQQTRWMGKCPDCGTWDSLVEQVERKEPARAVAARRGDWPEPPDAAARGRDRRLRAAAGAGRGVRAGAGRRDGAGQPGADRRRSGYRQNHIAHCKSPRSSPTGRARRSISRPRSRSSRSSCAPTRMGLDPEHLLAVLGDQPGLGA